MKEAIELLRNNLKNQIGAHKQLLEIVRSEHEALIRLDLEHVQEAIFGKEALIGVIFKFERERLVIMQDITKALGVAADEMTLSQLAERVQKNYSPLSEEISQILSTLKTLVQQISVQNGRNRSLVASALKHVREMKQNMIGSLGAMSQTYGRNGKKSETGAEPRLLSSEA